MKILRNEFKKQIAKDIIKESETIFNKSYEIANKNKILIKSIEELENNLKEDLLYIDNNYISNNYISNNYISNNFIEVLKTNSYINLLIKSKEL